MSAPPRYAIYYVPSPDDALYRFGTDLLGYDAFSGHDRSYPAAALKALPDWHDVTTDPRKYGFHATLKAPFSLAEGKTEADLTVAFDRFARTPREIPVVAPVVGSISSFVAVVPDTPVTALIQLAADCVTDFDSLRAPLSNHDRSRRLKSPLTPRQIEYLDRWGYPYVFEEFRFHMTLAGSLPRPQRDLALAFLRDSFANLKRHSQKIDCLALLRQDGTDTRFIIVRHSRLTAA